MPRALKVYGWIGSLPPGVQHPHSRWNTQARLIIAAPSWAAARRALEALCPTVGVPGRDWISTTGNAHELRVALAQPGVLFYCPDQFGPNPEYRPWPKEATHG